MKVILIFVILFNFLFAKANTKESRQPIRTLIWWDYLPNNTIEKLQKNGFYPDVSIYNSNEVASARIFSKREKYDVAVVSSLVVSASHSSNIFDTQILLNLSKVRPYIDSINVYDGCIPLLWGATVFGSDSLKNQTSLNNIANLMQLRNKGYEIAILDDPFELSARLLADGALSCNTKELSSGISFKELRKCKTKNIQTSFNFEKKYFRSSVSDFLKGKKVAVYGWHGEIAQAAKENPNIQLVVPQNHPVIGVDYVCIPKNRAHPKLSKEQLVKFVELLTDPESTHWGVESTQYFSPYKNDLQGLSPAVVKLYQNLMSVMAQSPPFVLTAPDKDEHQLINNWWRGVRYESKK